MRFANGRVFCDDGVVRQKDFFVVDGMFTDVDEEYGNTLELGGRLILPGLIDTHIHGCTGGDFTYGTTADLFAAADFLAQSGITTFVPTLVSAPIDAMERAVKNIRWAQQNISSGAKILGINLEGPFLSPQKQGAQEAKDFLPPKYDVLQKLINLSENTINTVCVAPELGFAADFIKRASKVCNVSVGHTACSYKAAQNAFAAGASKAVHLFNAMSFHHREPSVLGAVVDSGEIFAELICDGIHVHESVIRMIFKLLPKEKIVLISDSISACGTDIEKENFLGTSPIKLVDGAVMLNDGKTLAGSASTLFECMKKAVSFNIQFSDAVLAATKNPAVSIGVYDQVGSITSGKFADFVLCDDNLNITAVFVRGQQISVL